MHAIEYFSDAPDTSSIDHTSTDDDHSFSTTTSEILGALDARICLVSNVDRRDIKVAIDHIVLEILTVAMSEDVRSYKPRPDASSGPPKCRVCAPTRPPYRRLAAL